MHLFKNTLALLFLLTVGGCSTLHRNHEVRFSKPVERETWIAPDKETTEQRDERMQWWREARFGLFIHWGVYSVPAGFYKEKPCKGQCGEWIMLRSRIPVDEYKDFASEFDPVNYDPEKWVLLAKEAGMKYIVITAKHHDGFALFDSKVTDWDIVDATPYGKDLLTPLAEACRKHGMKLGFYYSQTQDWNHPGGGVNTGGKWDPKQEGSFDEYIEKIAAPQVREILGNYGDIAVLWWDTPGNLNASQAKQLMEPLALQPAIITNDRLGKFGGGDFSTPEQFIPATGIPGKDWETCMTMNDTWGFRSDDHNWKSADELIRKLGEIASKGGNFLLNIGPDSHGDIPKPSIELLEEIGAWMKVNGEAIHGTLASPFSFLDWGCVTQRRLADGKTRLYLHVWEWPENGELEIPLANPVEDAFLLDGKRTLKVVDRGTSQQVKLPSKAPDAVSSVVVLDFAGEPDVTSRRFNLAGEDGTFVLDTQKILLHSHLFGIFEIDESGDLPKVVNWEDKAAWIEWELNVDQPENYTVDVVLSGASDPFNVVVEFLGQEGTLKSVFDPRGHAIKPKGQTLKADAVGSSNDDRRLRLGTMRLDRRGVYRIGLLPVGKGWKKGADIIRLELVPVKK